MYCLTAAYCVRRLIIVDTYTALVSCKEISTTGQTWQDVTHRVGTDDGRAARHSNPRVTVEGVAAPPTRGVDSATPAMTVNDSARKGTDDEQHRLVTDSDNQEVAR